MLAYLAFFLLVFVVTISTFFFLQSQETARAENAYAQQIAYTFADSIQRAFMAGPGFSQSVAIPSTLLGKPYIIAVSHASDPGSSQTGIVYVWWNSPGQSGSFSAPTVTTSYSLSANVPGYITDDGKLIWMNSSIGTINMTNVNGMISFKRG
jgi:hypothetical protein